MKIKSQTPRCFKLNFTKNAEAFFGKIKPFFVPNNMNFTALRGNPEKTH